MTDILTPVWGPIGRQTEMVLIVTHMILQRGELEWGKTARLYGPLFDVLEDRALHMKSLHVYVDLKVNFCL